MRDGYKMDQKEIAERPGYLKYKNFFTGVTQIAIIIGNSELPPGLVEIVKVWSELPEHINAAIRVLVQTHNKKEKDLLRTNKKNLQQTRQLLCSLHYYWR